MTAPEQITKLVEHFENNKDSFKSGKYNETQLRREFIDPFFENLGWDVQNKQRYAEAYKDVIHEDAVKIGTAMKAPDYSFRIGGVRKYFVETKKPAVNIKEDIAPSFQLRRYAWSAKLPLSILTDFEEFAVYDCRVKPKKTDKASVGRILYMTYDEYLERWDEIASVFSRDAILKGSFDKYAEDTKSKRGTEEVDDAFLKEIEKWRDLLAKNIALRNPSLTQRELNYAVQQTIDRIVFLRICEDRGTEQYGRLLGEVNGTGIYGRLKQHFRDADARYNSGLFHFKEEKAVSEAPDTLTLTLDIDDDVLKKMISHLYYPDSPYEFSVLPSDILGHVYEQFLGKVIRLTEGHQAKIEEKPEVRKAGGVYYTPTYIVEYIVENTIGRLVEGKTPRQVSNLRIIDPACGSGSFLLGAYQFLLDWHLKYYMDNDPQKHQKALYQGPTGDWRLNTAERKRILLNNIYGVDIDSQAVEVTKLSLLLKVLEGETEQSLGQQMSMFKERALPNLVSNIKCGNSLIGSDFYATKQMGMFDEEALEKINAFDWQSEFSKIFSGKNGGFDAIIGNPPYIFTRELLTTDELQYFASKYKMSWEKKNTFMLFMELLLTLLKPNGVGSYIVPNSWLTIESAKLLREAYIPKLELIADLNYVVFRKVSMEPTIFVTAGKDQNKNNEVSTLRCTSKEELLSTTQTNVDRTRWLSSGRINFSASTETTSVVDRLVESSLTVGKVFDVWSGLQAYEAGKGNPHQSKEDVKNHVFDREKREDENSIRYLQGRDVGRYWLDWSGMWMQYGDWLAQPRKREIFTRPRVLLREITSDLPYCLHACFVEDDYLNNKSILNVLHDKNDCNELKLLLIILNSHLISHFYKQRAVKSARKIFPKVVIKNLREFPYPKNVTGENRKKALEIADQMISLHQKLVEVKTPHQQESLKRKIEVTNHQLDGIVYELFGLSKEEVSLIDNSRSEA